MKIVWDLDGTLYQDKGDYSEKREWKETPLSILLTNMDAHFNTLITGSQNLPKEIKARFDSVFERTFPLEPLSTYYSRYFQWKVDLIKKINPDLVFDDDQQICRFLNKSGIPAVWVPSCSYNGM